MNVLQGMDMDQFVVIVPTALVAMYVIIILQKKLSNGKNVHYGLIIPAICFVAATILAFKPLFALRGADADGLVGAALMVWMTFNIPTLALIFPYFMGLKNRKERQLIEEALAKEAAEAAEAEEKAE